MARGRRVALIDGGHGDFETTVFHHALDARPQLRVLDRDRCLSTEGTGDFDIVFRILLPHTGRSMRLSGETRTLDPICGLPGPGGRRGDRDGPPSHERHGSTAVVVTLIE
jgi:hypothetical protein